MSDNEAKTYQSGITWIDEHPVFKAVALPISDDQPEGEDIEEDESFEELDGEMMKRGTLSHSTIRWDWVIEESGQLLGKKAKDLRLMNFILNSLPQATTIPSVLPFAAHLVASFMSKWLETSFPQGRNHGRQLARIVDSLETMVSKVAEEGLEGQYRDSIMSALMVAGEALAESSADLGMQMAAMAQRVERAGEAEVFEDNAPVVQQQGQSQSQNQGAVSQTGAAGSTAQPAETQIFTPSAPLKPDKLQLDANNERGLKQSLSNVADFLLELDVSHPLSYRIRRYATWYGIGGPPPIKTEERTVIQPVSEDVLDGYRIAADRKQNDAEIVKRLERSCNLQPFWLEGQYIAWKLAKGNGRDKVASAIAEEAVLFARNSPWLATHQFSDGAPFLPDDVKTWLDTVQHVTTAAMGATMGNSSGGETGAVDQEMLQIVDEARDVAEEGDLVAAIRLLDTTRNSFASPRSATIWELLTMECLSDWGMKAHVSAQAARLEESITDIPVKEWDKDILDRIRRLTSG